VRVNFYPDSTAASGRDRFLAHRDFDLITLLLGANRPGLEIQARDGRWWSLTPSDTSIVVNAGDILAIESRGRIPSTMHRVVSPASLDGGRISMAYFVHPRREVPLADGRSAGEFLDARLRDAGYLR
jgi:isopenicillin N synthase-like dioxygenase